MKLPKGSLKKLALLWGYRLLAFILLILGMTLFFIFVPLRKGQRISPSTRFLTTLASSLCGLLCFPYRSSWFLSLDSFGVLQRMFSMILYFGDCWKI